MRSQFKIAYPKLLSTVLMILVVVVTFDSAYAYDLQGTVVRVVDGDTIRVMINHREETVRMIRIDTPETIHPSIPPEAWGKEASDYTKSLLTPGTLVYLELDVEHRDRYGRLLAYVYLGNGEMINERLVREGFAVVATFPPNVAHVERFLKAQREAQEECRGLWTDACQTMNNQIIHLSVDLRAETATLRNLSNSPVDLTDWKLISVVGCQVFIFPQIILPPDGVLVVLFSHHGILGHDTMIVMPCIAFWKILFMC